MNRNAPNKSKKRFALDVESDEETAAVTLPKRSLSLKRDRPSKKMKESGGKRGKSCSQSKLPGDQGRTKRSKRDIKYSVSSDSDDEEDSGNKSTGNRNMADSNAVELQSSNSSLDPTIVDFTLDTENASDATAVNADSMISVNEFQRGIAELLAESDRLIAESEASFVDLISPSPTKTEVINLVESPTIQVIDLTEDSPIIDQNVPECPVCYEQLNKRQTSVTPCGHYFCTDCIKKSLLRSKRCPTCRKKCFPKQLYPLFMWK